MGPDVENTFQKFDRHDEARKRVLEILENGTSDNVPENWARQLDPAQSHAVSAMVVCDLLGLCLFDEQGSGKTVMTIEGLSEDGSHPLQQAWLANNVPQCGYCQTGQIMQAADLLAKNPSPDEDQIMSAMQGNICRCGTYVRIKKAILMAADEMREA